MFTRQNLECVRYPILGPLARKTLARGGGEGDHQHHYPAIAQRWASQGSPVGVLGGRRAVAGSRRDGGGSPEAASTTPIICDPVRCVWNDRVRCRHSGTSARTGWPAHASPSRHVHWLCALQTQSGFRVQTMGRRCECHSAFCIHQPRLTLYHMEKQGILFLVLPGNLAKAILHVSWELRTHQLRL